MLPILRCHRLVLLVSTAVLLVSYGGDAQFFGGGNPMPGFGGLFGGGGGGSANAAASANANAGGPGPFNFRGPMGGGGGPIGGGGPVAGVNFNDYFQQIFGQLNQGGGGPAVNPGGPAAGAKANAGASVDLGSLFQPRPPGPMPPSPNPPSPNPPSPNPPSPNPPSPNPPSPPSGGGLDDVIKKICDLITTHGPTVHDLLHDPFGKIGDFFMHMGGMDFGEGGDLCNLFKHGSNMFGGLLYLIKSHFHKTDPSPYHDIFHSSYSSFYKILCKIIADIIAAHDTNNVIQKIWDLITTHGPTVHDLLHDPFGKIGDFFMHMGGMDFGDGGDLCDLFKHGSNMFGGLLYLIKSHFHKTDPSPYHDIFHSSYSSFYKILCKIIADIIGL